MENRKEKEIAYYDEAAEQLHAENGDFEGFAPSMLSSYQFLYNVAAPLLHEKKVLDYGCGNGVHLPVLAKYAGGVIGIDLSEGSLEIAKKVVSHENAEGKVRLLKMDCESLEFPDKSFDIVFDGGTFSSLDFQTAIGEITRVLTPEGILVGIETFGHNPIANIKRVFNRITGKRTSWAASHIIQEKEISFLQRQFEKVDVYYFHLFSLFAFPLLGLPGGRFVLRLLEKVDALLLRLPFLKKYAFKVVFVCSNPRYDKTTV